MNAGLDILDADVQASAAIRVLCVDDEPSIVSALRRLFRTRNFQVFTATSGVEALALLQNEPVDVIFSDMRMPGMDGTELLAHVRDRWPDTARILLTGYADMKSTIAAINSGEVYRYITKPWDDDEVIATVHEITERQALRKEKVRLEALTQAQNLALKNLNASLEEKVAERTHELSLLNQRLNKNYLTSIKVFSNLLEWRGGQLAGHARRVADLTRRTARAMGLPEADQQVVFIAALMHDIGQIGLSDSILSRPVPRLQEEEAAAYRKHPILGEQALMAMDDMQVVAGLIRAHHERHDGNGYPDKLAGNQIPLGARILSVVDTFDDLQSGHLSVKALSGVDARAMIARGRGSQFHPEVVDVFLQVLLQAAPVGDAPLFKLDSAQLVPGMVLGRDLISAEGVVLLAADQLLSDELIERIRQRERRDGIALVLFVRPPRR